MTGTNLFELFAVLSMKDNGFTKGIGDASAKTSGFTSNVKGLIDTVAGIKIVSAAFDMIRNSIGAAVERYDTLNRFPRVLQSMGFEASATEAATSKLAAGIAGLPTKLDDIVATAQNLTVLTGNLEQSVDISLALNNAFLASGASSADAARGMTQYTQQLSKGTVDMQSWRTLQETMGYALRQTAEAMGFVGQTATTDLYKALQTGAVTFDQFNAKIIELNSATGGFAELAKTASAGIGTSFTNMQTAVVRGITAIITALNRNRNIQVFIESVGKGFENLLKIVGGVTSFFTVVLSPALFVLSRSMGVLIPLVGTLGAAFLALNVLSLIGQVGGLTVAFNLLIGTKLKDLAITLQLHLLYAKDAIVKTASAIATGVMTAAENGNVIAKFALAAATKVATAAQWLWNVALSANPVGIVIVAVAALVAGIIALYNWMNKGTKANKDNAESGKEVAKSGDGIAASYDNASESIKKLSETIYNSYEDAKKAADEYNKHVLAKNYELVVNSQGRAKVISSADRRMYEEIKGYVDEHYSHLSEADKINQAKIIHGNKELLNQIRRDYYGFSPSTGASVADGLAKGMLDNRGAVQRAAKVLAGDVKKEMEKALEVKSPSKVTGRIGKFTVQGFVNAILAGRKAVKRAVTSIADVVDESLGGDARFGAGFGGTSLNEELVVEATTDGTAASAGAYTDNRVINVNVNGIRELDEIINWWQNQRLRERAAGAGV